MPNHIVSFVGGVLLAFVVCVVTALLVGSTVTVHTNHIDFAGGESRYLLQTSNDDGVIRHSIVDTRTGTTYVFSQEKADHVILAVDPEELDEPAEND